VHGLLGRDAQDEDSWPVETLGVHDSRRDQIVFYRHSRTILERSRDDGAYNAATKPRRPLKIEFGE
jgi:hypothetical protein